MYLRELNFFSAIVMISVGRQMHDSALTFQGKSFTSLVAAVCIGSCPPPPRKLGLSKDFAPLSPSPAHEHVHSCVHAQAHARGGLITIT